MSDEQRSTVPKQARPFGLRLKWAPCGVAAFGKGMTIACRLRLAERGPAWPHFRRQRKRGNN
ncbi:hypothetical protein ACE0DR_03340 [Azotobacter sp. CWF10]